MKISYVIPSINQTTMLINECIDSLIKYEPQSNVSDEIIVVDDGSSAETQEIISLECAKRNVRLILRQKNGGFPVAANEGIRVAAGDIVVMVNNDIQFTNPVRQEFVNAFTRDEKVGIVGSLLFYPHGTIQHGGIISVGNGGFTHRGWHRKLSEATDAARSSYMIGVTGALFGLRRKMFEEIGLFNEKYFLSCDDTELCLRAWSRDWRVWYGSDIRAIHAEGATRGRTDVEKQTKHRTWYLKEMETWGEFQKDIKQYSIPNTLMKVGIANMEMTGAVVSDDSERIVFDSVEQASADIPPGSRAIVVRRTGALGDVLLATPVIKRIKQVYPNHHVIVATVCPDIFKNSPYVSKTVRSLDGVVYDKFFDLDMSYEMQPTIPIWEAYAKTVFGDANFDPRPELFSQDIDASTLRQKLGSISLDRDKIAVLHMSVGWQNRTWSRDRWNDVSRRLSEVGYKVIVVGKGGDYRSDLFPGVLNLVDYLSIHEIRELCLKASVFVGIDSGMLHVAQTTSVPIVGLFTVANPKNRIVPRASRTIALIPKSSCRFCLHEQSPPVTFVACRFNTNHCLTEITADAVINAVTECARTK